MPGLVAGWLGQPGMLGLRWAPLHPAARALFLSGGMDWIWLAVAVCAYALGRKDGRAAERRKQGAEALRRLDMRHYDVVVLDLVMPEVNGMLDAYRASQRHVIENREIFERAGEAIMAKIMQNDRAVAALNEPQGTAAMSSPNARLCAATALDMHRRLLVSILALPMKPFISLLAT